MLDEELNSNPQAAAKNYEAMIAGFDQQRETAAQAIFRLGESYRRMGRIDEARLLYARILREFVDFPDLAKLSQRILTENAPTQPRGKYDSSAAAPNPAEEDLIRQELALLEQELAENDARVQAGLASSNSGLSVKREILQLKQRLARARTEEWPAPTLTPQSSAALSSSSQTYRGPDIPSDPGRLKAATKDLENQIALLSENVQPETLSTQVIKDPRFADLKSVYEKRLLSSSGDEESEKARALAKERLTKWIHDVYLPELKSTLDFNRARLDALEKQSEKR
jgi:hypothetical protein